MALKVIGAGLGRTGTASLKVALETLGIGRCYHMGELMSAENSLGLWLDAAGGRPDWDRIYDGYSAAVDNPTCIYWRELADHYPDAKVVLSVRDPRRWLESARTTIYSTETIEIVGRTPFNPLLEKVLYQPLEDQLNNEDFMVSFYNQHCDAVKEAIPEDRLLVYEVKEGWGPLCEFLDAPIPNEPFPHVNSRDEFRQMLDAMRASQTGQNTDQSVGTIAGNMLFVDRKKN